jgi:hypothetical protein
MEKRMSDPVVLDRSVISWLLALAGAFILFLLGIGVKDVRDKMKKVDVLCVRVGKLEERLDMEIRDRERHR